MWKQRAVALCGCLAILPLVIGCTNGFGGPPQADAPQAYAPVQAFASEGYAPRPYAPAEAYAQLSPTTVVAADIGGARVYAVGPPAPAAIVVMLPGPGDMMTANPQLLSAQGFDVVTPTRSEIYQIAAEQQAAAARLIDQAQALTDAPIWLVGANPTIAAALAAMPPDGAGQVSGVVVTSTTSGAGTCSERMVYSYSGNGAVPKVSVSKSGDACPPGSPFGGGSNSTIAPAAPVVPPHAPRLIEASVQASTGSPAAQRSAVRQIADMIKSPPG